MGSLERVDGSGAGIGADTMDGDVGGADVVEGASGAAACRDSPLGAMFFAAI